MWWKRRIWWLWSMRWKNGFGCCAQYGESDGFGGCGQWSKNDWFGRCSQWHCGEGDGLSGFGKCIKNTAFVVQVEKKQKNGEKEEKREGFGTTICIICRSRPPTTCYTKFLHNYWPLNYTTIFHFRSLNDIAIYKTKFVHEKSWRKVGVGRTDRRTDGQTDTTQH